MERKLTFHTEQWIEEWLEDTAEKIQKMDLKDGQDRPEIPTFPDHAFKKMDDYLGMCFADPKYKHPKEMRKMFRALNELDQATKLGKSVFTVSANAYDDMKDAWETVMGTLSGKGVGYRWVQYMDDVFARAELIKPDKTK